MLEVARQHLFCKLVGFVDDKSSAIMVPAYSFSVCRILSTKSGESVGGSKVAVKHKLANI